MDDRPLAASSLGSQFGLSAQETNWLLFNHGILDGEPSAWTATEKGKTFIVEHHPYRGPGVYNHYPSDYPTTWYDPSIKDELTVTPETKEQLREQIRAHRAAKDAAKPTYGEDTPADDAFDGMDGRTLAVAVAATVGVILATATGVYVVRRYGPTWKRKWQESALPHLERAKARLTRRGASPVDVGDEGAQP